MKFKFTGIHPDELSSGRPLAPGDEVVLTESERESNSRLIDEGLLVAFPREPKKQAKKSKAQERDK